MQTRTAGSRLYPWYDSTWLERYAKAKAIVKVAKPEALPAFIEAFRIFQTSPAFKVSHLRRVFHDDTLDEIRREITHLRPADLELHETRQFRRFVVHNNSVFNELHERTVQLVSDAVGEAVEPSYNFLSLYGRMGVCPVHMDAPTAKWTLDLCVDQSMPWPIYFSQVQPWPESGGDQWPSEDWERAIKQSPLLRFTPYTLQPGEALVFSGSSQWHYREALPANGQQFCNLLFFHFIPRGTSELLRAANWARIFGIEELAELA